MAYDYKASLKAWMAQHMLSPLDVRDILNEMRKDEANRTADGANWMFPSTGSNSLSDVDDSMDGDFDSAMASAGHGTDEDYGGGCYQMEDFGWAGDENLCGE